MKKRIPSISINSYLLYPLILSVLVIIATLLRIHGSSIGIYHNLLYGNSYKDSNLFFSKPNIIRGDEWLVSTPYTLSQVINNYSSYNFTIGLGQEMSILYDTPTSHWSTFFKSYNWSFFVLPVEFAFSFKWWFRSFLLLTSTYVVFLFITKRIVLSIGISILILLSPFMQWWYSTSAVEVITYGFLSLFFYFQLFKSLGKRYYIMLGGFLYFLICYVLVLYPPFQIAIGLLLISIGFGYILNNRKTFFTYKKKFIWSLILCTVVVLGVISLYYWNFKDILIIIQNTVYPGRRLIEGGGYSFVAFLSGFYNIQFLDLRPVPSILAENPSEASGFFILFIFILPFSLYLTIKNFINDRKIDYLYLGIICYLCFTLWWLFIGFSTSVEKFLLLSKVPHQRMLFGIGIANFFIISYFLGLKIKKRIDYKVGTIIASIISAILYVILGAYFQNYYTWFLPSLKEVFLIAGVVGISVLLLLLQREKLFLLCILIFSFVSSAFVNPIYQGLDPLTNTSFANFISSTTKTSEKFRWVTYGTPFLGDYIIANGGSSLNGDHFYPQFNLWRLFDPDTRFKDYYNRYAHVLFEAKEDEKIEMVLNRYEFFTVKVNPCHPLLKDLSVRYYVFIKPVQFSCLNFIWGINYTRMPIYVYELRES